MVFAFAGDSTITSALGTIYPFPFSDSSQKKCVCFWGVRVTENLRFATHSLENDFFIYYTDHI
jgi:hypothetical protein